MHVWFPPFSALLILRVCNRCSSLSAVPLDEVIAAEQCEIAQPVSLAVPSHVHQVATCLALGGETLRLQMEGFPAGTKTEPANMVNGSEEQSTYFFSLTRKKVMEKCEAWLVMQLTGLMKVLEKGVC